MTTILEIKGKLQAFYVKNDVFIIPVLKFIAALIVFIQINNNIGYFTKLTSTSVTMVFALLGAILPVGGTVFLASVVILAHLYALSLEVAIMGLVLILLLYFFYFRFAPKSGMNALLTPICIKLHLESIVPIANGLLSEWYSIVSMACGVVVYYFLTGIKDNAETLSEKMEGGMAAKFTSMVNQLLGNKEMYLVILTFSLTTILVILIRKLPIKYSWQIAICIGLVVSFLVRLAGYLMLGVEGKVGSLVTGTIVAGVIAFVIQFVAHNLDYERVERVQFEDDDYYYYVKAIPKNFVAEKEKSVKTISTKKKRVHFTEEEVREQLENDNKINY